MMIQIRYFAAIREAVGLTEEEIPLEVLGDQPTVQELWGWLETQYPNAALWRARVRVARNHEFVSQDERLEPGDEIALIPPVSGGSASSVEGSQGRCRVTTAPLDVAAVEALVLRQDAGAVVTYTGRVRDHTGDHDVSYLIYEAYPEMALKKLEETVAQAVAQWPEIECAVHHRYGRLELGEAAVVICVTSPHRKDAFEACPFIIDTLKQVVPIWKKEVGPGGQEWVGFGP